MLSALEGGPDSAPGEPGAAGKTPEKKRSSGSAPGPDEASPGPGPVSASYCAVSQHGEVGEAR